MPKRVGVFVKLNCLEEADNGPDLHRIRLGGVSEDQFTTQYRADLPGGVMTLESPGCRETDEDWDGALYAPRRKPLLQAVNLRWIPYYAWANRGVGEMRVWVRE